MFNPKEIIAKVEKGKQEELANLASHEQRISQLLHNKVLEESSVYNIRGYLRLQIKCNNLTKQELQDHLTNLVKSIVGTDVWEVKVSEANFDTIPDERITITSSNSWFSSDKQTPRYAYYYRIDVKVKDTT